MADINQQTGFRSSLTVGTPLPGWADLLVPKIYALLRNFLNSIGI
jgi:hypothetical protein